MTPPPPCRLFVIMARAAPRAVVFRRGPSKHTQLILWHTDTDRFEPGQWFKGRIYERRSDLSPDGSLLVYFAAKHKEPYYSWTAISKPPYLTALVMWQKGDCWDGGGLFESERKIWLNHPPDASQITRGELPERFEVRCNSKIQIGEDRPIDAARLTRDGWKIVQEYEFERVMHSNVELIEQMKELLLAPDNSCASPNDKTREMIERFPIETAAGYKTIRPEIRVKQSNSGSELERRESCEHYDFIHKYSFRFRRGKEIPDVGADWADFDQSGRLVFARAGKLFAGNSNSEGDLVETEIHDFNDATFAELPAPPWATDW